MTEAVTAAKEIRQPIKEIEKTMASNTEETVRETTMVIEKTKTTTTTTMMQTQMRILRNKASIHYHAKRG